MDQSALTECREMRIRKLMEHLHRSKLLDNSASEQTQLSDSLSDIPAKEPVEAFSPCGSSLYQCKPQGISPLADALSGKELLIAPSGDLYLVD